MGTRWHMQCAIWGPGCGLGEEVGLGMRSQALDGAGLVRPVLALGLAKN
jgi:hypothetical protein